MQYESLSNHFLSTLYHTQRKHMKIQEPNKETIWHFTCIECHGFWSIAVMDKWLPYKLYCPHCGNREAHSSGNNYAEPYRREKNDAQLRHEAKVFDDE